MLCTAGARMLSFSSSPLTPYFDCENPQIFDPQIRLPADKPCQRVKLTTTVNRIIYCFQPSSLQALICLQIRPKISSNCTVLV